MSRHSSTLRFLRPYLHTTPRSITPAYARFFTAVTTLRQSTNLPEATHIDTRQKSADQQKRVRKLESHGSLSSFYPPIPTLSTDVPSVSASSEGFHSFREWNDRLENNQTAEGESVRANGRVLSVRRASSRLAFITIRCVNGNQVQGMCDASRLQNLSEEETASLIKFLKCVRRGDWISIHGSPHKSSAGELSIIASSVPRIDAPAMNQIPTQLDDEETLARHAHVDMILHQKSLDVLKLHDTVEWAIQCFLKERGFVKVNTPILNAGAGGAVARPFQTVATELADTTLDLRIAPELFLKRLIVGGIQAVYELGPAFRNEGVDATHNPEFTICEFYQAYASLDNLINLTQALFGAILVRVQAASKKSSWSISEFPEFGASFAQLAFVPTLQAELRKALNQPDYVLPDLSRQDSKEELETLLSILDISIAPQPSLPRLLDALAGRFIEPLCRQPTFIMYHPACMSPLARSFTDLSTKQLVSARAELFINGIEYANMYEEENNPFEQRRKFEEQLAMRGNDGETSASVDESYIEALEWGMPPTGGWGCGVDRIVMLFAGTHRIADVLPFGTLRNVVGMAQNGKA